MKDSALSELATHSNIRPIDYARDRKGRIHVFIVDKNDIMNSKELFGFESFKYAGILSSVADKIVDGTITTTDGLRDVIARLRTQQGGRGNNGRSIEQFRRLRDDFIGNSGRLQNDGEVSEEGEYFSGDSESDGIPRGVKHLQHNGVVYSYYDHSLSEIAKGDLLNSLGGTTPLAEKQASLVGVKDKRLLWLLQPNNEPLRLVFGELKPLQHDGVVYGYYDPKTREPHLNEDFISFDTPIHEFTHIWWEVVRANDKRITDQIVSLMKQTKEFKSLALVLI